MTLAQSRFAVVGGFVAALLLSGVLGVTSTSGSADLSSAAMKGVKGGDLDCADFSSQAAAQNAYESSGPGDPHGLDADNDGIACETNPCPCSTGGNGGGSGGSPPGRHEPTDRVEKKLCGKFIGAARSTVCFKAKFEGNDLKWVKSFRFRRLPSHCSDGSDTFAFAHAQRVNTRRNGFRERFLWRYGEGQTSNLDVLIAGRINGVGEKARGKVRMRNNRRGAFCTTREREWKAHDQAT